MARGRPKPYEEFVVNDDVSIHIDKNTHQVSVISKLSDDATAAVLYNNRNAVHAKMVGHYDEELQYNDGDYFTKDAVTYSDAATIGNPVFSSLNDGTKSENMANAIAASALNRSVDKLGTDHRRNRGRTLEGIKSGDISPEDKEKFSQNFWGRHKSGYASALNAAKQAAAGDAPAPVEEAPQEEQPAEEASTAPAEDNADTAANVSENESSPAQPRDEAEQAAGAAQAAADDVQAAEAGGGSAPATATAVGRSGITPHNEVAEVQALLKLTGTDAGPVDGIDGTLTQNGMTAYANKLSAENIHITERSPQGIRAHLMSRLTGTSPEDIAFQIEAHQNAIDAIASGDADKIKAAQTFFNVKGYTDGQGQSLKIDGVVGSRTNAALEKAQQELTRLQGLQAGPAADAPAADAADTPGAETPVTDTPPAAPIRVLDGVNLGIQDADGRGIRGADRNVEAWNAKPRDMGFYMANGGNTDNGVLSVSNKGQLIFAQGGQARDISELMLLDRKQTSAVTTFDRAKELGLNGTKVVFAPGTDMDEHYQVLFNKMRETHGANFDEKTGVAITMNVEAAGTDPQYTMRVFRGEDGKLQGQIVTDQNDASYQSALQQTPTMLSGAIKSDQLDKYDFSRTDFRADMLDMKKGAGQPTTQTAFGAAADPAASPVPAAPQADPIVVGRGEALPPVTGQRGDLVAHYEHARDYNGSEPLERSRHHAGHRDYGANPFAHALRGPNDAMNEMAHGAARLPTAVAGGALSLLGLRGQQHESLHDCFNERGRHDHRDHHGPDRDFGRDRDGMGLDRDNLVYTGPGRGPIGGGLGGQ